MSTDDRATLRRQMRAKLRAFAPEVRMRAAAGVARQLDQTGWLKPGLKVAGFWSLPYELPMLIAQVGIEKAGAQYFLPILHADQTLRFARFKAGDAVRVNRFGIPEPLATESACTAADLDVILMPLTAFDRQGNRLGSGGGWYDRTLAGSTAPRRVGVAYAAQEVPALVPAAWDVPLHHVLTEQTCLACQPFSAP
ncbi:5-formyltetrahydrofolate cyclo-ligase [Ahniella affigens]|uniref:5-formyltetrahydrofolate cyclo-ligase n=1 Tax=Ahniella affigens TaxID=2021234 RepID=A0A2P1PTQ1_9GAMM|nr:5-formyltetrahydrofolate cyclo-ligase [Ahniella affigens]AVP98200.1 5-formyltetrahydrofolate cyclo-ligase [Ahniella affigens]